VKSMKNVTALSYAQNQADPDGLPLDNPPLVVVVECDISRSFGCFDYREDPTTTHQTSPSHIDAMADWAVGQGMFSKDAHELAAREPLKFDEAIHEILNMETGRLERLHNVGGWMVWFVRNKAVGSRRYVEDKPYRDGTRY
jgi:hypothetical protein